MTATGKQIINDKFLFEYGRNKQMYYDDPEKVHEIVNYILSKNTPEYASLNNMLNHQFDYDKNYQEAIRHAGQITDDFTADNYGTRLDNLTDQTTYNEKKELTHGHVVTDVKSGSEEFTKAGSETDTTTFNNRASTTEYGADNDPRKTTTTEKGQNTVTGSSKPFDGTSQSGFEESTKSVEQVGGGFSGTGNTNEVVEDGKEKTTETGSESTEHSFSNNRKDTTTYNNLQDQSTHSGKDTDDHTGTKTDTHTGTQSNNDIKDEFNDRRIDETTTKTVTGLDIIDQYNKIREFYKQNLWDKIVRDLLDVLTYRTYITSYWDL